MSEIFRDRTEGAIARRQDLLRKRRDEFVMMPHAIRRVVVARAARKAAAIAMIMSGVAMLVVAMSPALAGNIARGLPGINPAVVSTFVGAAWILGLVAYAASRARSEHRFAVEMMAYVLPGADLDHDIERLSHEQPDQVARQMAHRLEVASAALPVAAAAFVLPATLVYIAHAIYAKGWPSTAAYEGNLVEVASALVVAAVAGSIAAIAITRRAARSPAVTPVASVIALLSGTAAAAALEARELPATWILTVVCVISGAIAFINWRLARERTAIEAEDPAAGSELFTLRGFIATVRGGIAAARRRVSAPMALGAVAFGTLLVCAGSPITAGSNAAAASPTVRTQVAARSSKVVAGASAYQVLPTGDGRLRITATFQDGMPIEVMELSGMSTIPRNWKASIVVRLESHDLPGLVSVSPFSADPSVAMLHLGGDTTEHRFSTEVCDGRDQPLGLTVIPDAGWPPGTYHATFLVEPVLELSTCR